MKNLISAFGLILAASVASAATTVSVTGIAQDSGTGVVTVGYTLTGDPAVVTMEALDGETVLPDVAVSSAYGDVNRVVEATAGDGCREIRWPTRMTWPNRTTSALSVRLTAWPTNDPPTYMTVDLQTGALRYYVSTNALPGGLADDTYRKTKMVFRKITAAGIEWTMGAKGYEQEWMRDNQRDHQVILSRNYYCAIYETTQYQFVGLMNWIASAFTNDVCRGMRPVERLEYAKVRGGSWPKGWNGGQYDGKPASGSFIARLREKTGSDAFDLPFEAQWEYACRAGSDATYPDGTSTWNLFTYTGALVPGTDIEPIKAIVSRYARWQGNGGYVGGTVSPLPDVKSDRSDCDASVGTAIVGSYEPNAWGLYDMLGNVQEVCVDGCFGQADQSKNAGVREWMGISDPTQSIVDPTTKSGPNDGACAHVWKGGAWNSGMWYPRAAWVDNAWNNEYWSRYATVGFRVVMNL